MTSCRFNLIQRVIEVTHHYHLQTKLQEGNVFSCDCPSVSHSVYGERSQCTGLCPGPTLYTTPAPVPYPSVPGPGSCTIQVPDLSPETCSNLFNLDLTVQGPRSLDTFKLVQLGTSPPHPGNVQTCSL